ncbi:MAG TPA: AbrB/MazE/SpoVT family DNA-binding domain-containing protein [bacterium]|nr:AbrB/MazE/SpoVT family DNA-binding domain-containing protein [bacterium]
MLAKLTSKNQITLPKSAVMAFEGASYYDVEVRPDGLMLRPAKLQVGADPLAEARRKFREKGFDEGTIADAVKWARKKRKK